MIEINKIYNEDCLEGMKRINDGSVDMILCDLPYGTIYKIASDNVKHGMSGKTGWDKKIPITPLLENYNRLLRMNGCVVLFSQEPFTTELITGAHNNIPFSYRMVWIKDHFANSLIAKKSSCIIL